MIREGGTRRVFLKGLGGLGASLVFNTAGFGREEQAPAQDPAYRSGRPSVCEAKLPRGRPLKVKKSDTGIRVTGHRAERIRTYVADAAALKGGDLRLCAEYGRIEIVDSDDGQIRLQVRCEALGGGASKAIEDTDIRIHFLRNGDRLGIAVWPATQGFTPTYQPCLVHVRLQVPAGGAYRVEARADHGCVGVRRLTVAGGSIRGRVGSKIKAIKGYLGGHDLEQVALAGDLELWTESAPITATFLPQASCTLLATTMEGEIQLSFTPDPRLGLNVVAGSNGGEVAIRVPDAMLADPPERKFRAEQHARTKDYQARPIQVTVRATSEKSGTTVVSDM